MSIAPQPDCGRVIVGVDTHKSSTSRSFSTTDSSLRTAPYIWR